MCPPSVTPRNSPGFFVYSVHNIFGYYKETLKCLSIRYFKEKNIICAPGIITSMGRPIWSSVEVAFRPYFRSRISELQFLFSFRRNFKIESCDEDSDPP